MKKLFVLFTHLLLAVPALAQGLPARIGVVDFQHALNEVEEGKKAKKTLEGKYEGKRQELESRKAELETLKQALEAQAVMLSDQARRSKEEDYSEKLVAFQQALMESNQEMAAMEQDLTGDILEKLSNVAATIGKEQGYTLIIEATAVVYSPDYQDITPQVIQRFNQKAPPKTTPAPAAGTKPAGTKTP